MVSEKVCLDVLKYINCCEVAASITYFEDDGTPDDRTHKVESASTVEDLYRWLLGRYDLNCIDSSVRWLEYGKYVVKSWPIGKLFYHVFQITQTGKDVVMAGRFPKEDRKLFYRDEDPYSVFIAHQFSRDDESLVNYIEKRVRLMIPFRW